VSGITNLLVPKLNAAMIYLRIALLLAAAVLGFYGLILGVSVLIIHILALTSFGVSQLSREESPDAQSFKDTLIRAPWNAMLKRPALMARDAVRQRRPK
jgi:spore germination protein KA